MAEKNQKVVFATPTLRRPHPAFLAAMESTIPVLDRHGVKHFMTFEVGSPYISWARASLLRKALDAGADIIVFIDHDLSWKPDDLCRLIDTPGDVVAGLYRFKKDDVHFMGVLEGDDCAIVRDDLCIKANRVPAGFLKVTKEAVDRFMEAYPELVFGPRYKPSVDLFNHGASDGVWWGEDYAFSRRWISCGGEIWIQPDLTLTHHGDDKSYTGNFRDYMRRQPGGDLAG